MSTFPASTPLLIATIPPMSLLSTIGIFLDTLLFSTTTLPGPVVSPDPFGFFISIPNRPLLTSVFPFTRFSPGP